MTGSLPSGWPASTRSTRSTSRPYSTERVREHVRPNAVTPSGATFSRCRRWRYLLWRKWSDGPIANFLMLNPSTADEVQLDPSCTRARLYAERWGFGALVVTNLFGWRATDPDEMKSARDPVGLLNDAAILKAAKEADLVVCAWGNHGAHLGLSLIHISEPTRLLSIS